jgi:hypothetical protein
MVLLDEDEPELEGEGWELDPNDPTHPDFDLSEAAGYKGVESRRGWFPLPRTLVIVITVLIIQGMIWPACAQIF